MGIKINIKTVKPGTLPFNRVGDWTWRGETLQISVNDMSEERYEWLLAVHEVVEAFLCKFRGITEQAIDKFDKDHNGAWLPEGPGYPEHLFATGVESIIAAMVGITIDTYEKEIEDGSKDQGGLDILLPMPGVCEVPASTG